MSDTDAQISPALTVYEPSPTSTSALVLDRQSIESMMKLAETMMTAKVTVPEHLRNGGDCLAVIMQAMQWGMNPFSVAQKTHLVNGKLGYEAQLVNAVVTASGAIQGHFRYEYKGDGERLECRVGATLRGDNEVTWSEWLCIASVTTRNSPLWKTNPRQQMAYLQTKNWTRLYAPGPILGVYTPDELEVPTDGQRIAPDPKRDILPEFPDADFQKNLPAYTKAIEGGKQTADTILAKVRSKWIVTEAQEKELRAIQPKQAEQPAAQGA